MGDYSSIIRNIKEGKYAPVYFLQGEETFFIDNIIKHIEVEALDESQKSFNQYVLYGKETDFSTILNTAQKFPMMGERQVVIIKEAQELKGWNDSVNQELFSRYLNNPVASTILVFGYKYKTIDKRTKLGKELEGKSEFLNSKKIYDDKLPGWINSYCQASGMKISARASHLLAESIGNDLQRLANEIDKLKLNYADQELDENDIHKHVGISKEYNVFELQKALSVGSFEKCLRIVNYFSANPSSNPVVITIGMLYSYFSKLLILHQRGGDTLDKSKVASAIGVPPFFAQEYVAAVRRYSFNKVCSNLIFLNELDLKSKGVNYILSKEKERGFWQEMIFRLMH